MDFEQVLIDYPKIKAKITLLQNGAWRYDSELANMSLVELDKMMKRFLLIHSAYDQNMDAYRQYLLKQRRIN